MTPERVDRIAHHLADAWREGRAWAPPQFDELTFDEAYAIQDRVVRLLGWFADGHPAAWKAGGNPKMTAAPLPRVQQSNSKWQVDGLEDIVVEAEISLHLARTPQTVDEVPHCIGGMCASIEIIGTRLKNGLKAPPAWKLADLQVHAGSVMGAPVPYAPRDWQHQVGTLTINGEVMARFEGTHPNGDPALPVAWLFEHARLRTGGLRAGDAIMTGAWALAPAKPGDLVEVQFENVGNASVQLAP